MTLDVLEGEDSMLIRGERVGDLEMVEADGDETVEEEL